MRAPDATRIEVINFIRAEHRRRRFAMKVQQKVDRALESFVRRNCTDWHFDADEKARKKFNEQTVTIIKTAQTGEGDPIIVELVQATGLARKPFDAVRKAAEKKMAELAEMLPVADGVRSIHGAGLPGLATIVAEAGDLSNYRNPAKLWNRLGYAPFDGYAGSTWKRRTWRPRALSADEWVEHPFAGERYALMFSISESLWRAQWIGAKKAGTDEGIPDGPYGEIYAKRRAHTLVTHPDWTKMHSHKDALRVMMKRFLLDLWFQWQRDNKPATVPAPVSAPLRRQRRSRKEPTT
jgi:hypothetical protein